MRKSTRPLPQSNGCPTQINSKCRRASLHPRQGRGYLSHYELPASKEWEIPLTGVLPVFTCKLHPLAGELSPEVERPIQAFWVSLVGRELAQQQLLVQLYCTTCCVIFRK
jgi:hypothetical protein